MTILNNFAASRNIGRDQWLCHSGSFEQRSRRALAIGRENHAIGLGDERPNIIRGPEVLDYTLCHPTIDIIAGHGRAIFGVEKTKQSAVRFRVCGLDKACRVDELPDALVVEEPGNQQEPESLAPAWHLRRLE